MQPDHDRDVGLRGEELVLGEPEDEALEDLVGHRDARFPQDQPHVERRRLRAGAVAARVHVLDEGGLGGGGSFNEGVGLSLSQKI